LRKDFKKFLRRAAIRSSAKEIFESLCPVLEINGDRYLFNSSILRGAGEDGTDTVAMPAKNGTDTHLPAVNRNQSLFSLQSPFSLSRNIKLLSPLGFKESLFLWKDAKVVLTDSGGLQEETTALGVPCVTIRENTERPITVELGTNVLAGTTKAGILRACREALKKARHATVPPSGMEEQRSGFGK
jgi:hypothetical protein